MQSHLSTKCTTKLGYLILNEPRTTVGGMSFLNKKKIQRYFTLKYLDIRLILSFVVQKSNENYKWDGQRFSVCKKWILTKLSKD